MCAPPPPHLLHLEHTEAMLLTNFPVVWDKTSPLQFAVAGCSLPVSCTCQTVVIEKQVTWYCLQYCSVVIAVEACNWPERDHFGFHRSTWRPNTSSLWCFCEVIVCLLCLRMYLYYCICIVYYIMCFTYFFTTFTSLLHFYCVQHTSFALYAHVAVWCTIPAVACLTDVVYSH